MAESELIISDSYCSSAGNTASTAGKNMDVLIGKYLTILNNIRTKAITSGDVANALDTYIKYAEKLRGQFSGVSESAKEQALNFIKKVDEADQYLF